jgi:DNA-binding GntR family transcriptional regulator
MISSAGFQTKQEPFDDERSGQTAEEEAYRHLLRAIRSGRYRPGDRLIPEDIAAEIGMSRMPVREAFRRLATEGLVVIRPNRGCIISGLTIPQIYEVFEIRSVLEGLAVRLAMPRIDAATLRELERQLDAMNDDPADWVANHSKFHDHLCSLSGRPKLLRQIRTLHASIEPYLRVYLHHAEKPRSADAAHRVILEALRTGDADHAEAVMRAHVLGTAPILANFINASALGGAGEAAAPTGTRA